MRLWGGKDRLPVPSRWPRKQGLSRWRQETGVVGIRTMTHKHTKTVALTGLSKCEAWNSEGKKSLRSGSKSELAM